MRLCRLSLLLKERELKTEMEIAWSLYYKRSLSNSCYNTKHNSCKNQMRDDYSCPRVILPYYDSKKSNSAISHRLYNTSSHRTEGALKGAVFILSVRYREENY